MKDIYNKILKEALDIMDFDSWDDSEQTFKDNIEKTLTTVFIYERSRNEDYLWILDNGELGGFPQFHKYKDKVRYNGKLIPIEENYGTWHLPEDLCPPHRSFSEEFYITIDDINDISGSINCMFFETDIKKVPKFNTRKVIEMRAIFRNAKSLQSVPLLDMSGIVDSCKNILEYSDAPFSIYWDNKIRNMFDNCKKLDKQTRDIWQLNEFIKNHGFENLSPDYTLFYNEQ